MIDLSGYKIEVYDTNYTSRIDKEPLGLYNLVIYKDIKDTLYNYILLNKVYINVGTELLFGGYKSSYYSISTFTKSNSIRVGREEELKVLLSINDHLVKDKFKECFSLLVDKYLFDYGL